MKDKKLLNWKGKIETVAWLKDDAESFGEFVVKKDFSIKISLNRNKTVAEFLSSILHELLHLWIKIVKATSTFRCTVKEEHQFVYAVEHAARYFFYVVFEERKKTKPVLRKKKK